MTENKLDWKTMDVEENDNLEVVGIGAYKKAIAAVVGAVVAVAAIFGTNIDPEASQSVITALTAIAVYLVPNEQGTVEIEDHDRERVGQ